MHLFTESHYASPYALSVYVALKQKGIDFDLRTVDLDAGAQHAPAFAAQSLTQRIPLLVDGDFALTESSAITEYLDEVYPGTPLYPRDPKTKARARQVQAWIRSDLMPIRVERSTFVIFYGRVDGPLSAEAQAAADKLFQAADALLPQDGGNLFGDWSIADLDLALMLNRLVLAGDAVPARLADYARRQWALPAVQEWLALPRPGL